MKVTGSATGNRTRRAFTLIEIVMTMSVVSTLIVILFNLFLTSQRRYVSSETHLNSAMLAQMIIERVKSHLLLNPRMIRELYDSADGKSWSFRGNVVDPNSSTAPSLPVVPLFEHLFTHTGASVQDPGNKVALTPLASRPAGDPERLQMESLLDTFRDYEVEIRIEDDADPETRTAAARPEQRELVKVMTVRVFQRQGGKGRSQPFTLSTRLVTPSESLSKAARESLDANFGTDSLQTSWDAFFGLVGQDNPYFNGSAFDLAWGKALADCWIMLGMAQNEAFLLEGSAAVDLPPDRILSSGIPSRSIDGWIQTLVADKSYEEFAVFKKELAKLYGLRMRVRFDSFKRMRPVLIDLEARHRALEADIKKWTTILRESLDQIIQLNATTQETIEKHRENEQKRTEARKDADEAKKKKEEAEKKLAEEVSKLLDDAVKKDGEAATHDANAALLSASADTLEDSGGDAIEVAKLRGDAAKERTEASKKRAEGNEKRAEAGRKRAEHEREIADAAQDLKDALEDIAEAEAALTAAERTLETTNSSFAENARKYGESLFEAYELTLACKLINDFFTDDGHLRMLGRVLDYHDRIEDDLRLQREAITRHLAFQDQTTPFERVFSAQRMAEVVKIRQIFEEAPSNDLRSLLLQIAAPYEKTLQPLHAYLTRGTAHDFAALRDQNRYSLERMQALRQTAETRTARADLKSEDWLSDATVNPVLPHQTTSLYEKILVMHHRRGSLRGFLDLYTEVSNDIRLDSDKIVSKLQDRLAQLRSQVDYVADASAEEILKALTDLGL